MGKHKISKREREIIFKAMEIVELAENEWDEYTCLALSKAENISYGQISSLIAKYGDFYSFKYDPVWDLHDPPNDFTVMDESWIKSTRLTMLALFAEINK